VRAPDAAQSEVVLLLVQAAFLGCDGIANTPNKSEIQIWAFHAA
jgi:hypothetical protein